MSAPATPRTAAGRAVLLDLVELVEAVAPKQSKKVHDVIAQGILAIEAEAAEPAGAGLREALEPVLAWAERAAAPGSVLAEQVEQARAALAPEAARDGEGGGA